MILLQYELECFWKGTESSYSVGKITHFDIRPALQDILDNNWFKGMVFEFRNSGHLCLVCKFTGEACRTDSRIMHLEAGRKKKQTEFYGGIMDLIAAELTAYEQGRFTYREITI